MNLSINLSTAVTKTYKKDIDKQANGTRADCFAAADAAAVAPVHPRKKKCVERFIYSEHAFFKFGPKLRAKSLDEYTPIFSMRRQYA